MAARYTNPPITEALLDIRIERPEGPPPFPLLTAMGAAQAEKYPRQEELRTFNAELRLGATGNLEALPGKPNEQVGIIRVGNEDKEVFQARADGFTFSRLAPYRGWQEFRSEAHRLWSAYREAVGPLTVKRVAIRTINRLDLPLPFADFNVYLNTYPHIPPGLPQELHGFLLRTISQYADLKATLMLTESIIQPHRPGVASIVLDIDLFRTDEIPADDDAVWELLEALRTRKDEAFEACITDEARRLFQ